MKPNHLFPRSSHKIWSCDSRAICPGWDFATITICNYRCAPWLQDSQHQIKTSKVPKVQLASTWKSYISTGECVCCPAPVDDKEDQKQHSFGWEIKAELNVLLTLTLTRYKAWLCLVINFFFVFALCYLESNVHLSTPQVRWSGIYSAVSAHLCDHIRRLLYDF